MTEKEFSLEFDLVYNNISSNIMAPGINEYEKSVFLTRALEDLVIELSNSYEQDGQSSLYLKELILTQNIPNPTKNGDHYKLDIPSDCLKICKEIINNNHDIMVIPTKTDYLYKYLRNPFKKPSVKRSLRVILENNLIVYFDLPITNYQIIYIKKPDPIITQNLAPYEKSINGLSSSATSKLNSILHNLIVRNAAIMAANIYKSK